jgi:polyisoprenoid-binding protein YceI
MKISKFFPAVALAFVLAGHATADSPTRWSGAADIAFLGTSTLHDWSGKVATEPFTATVVMDDGGKPRSLSAVVEVKASKMDTANADRDAKMRKSMRVLDFPLIKGEFKNVPFTSMMPDGKTPAKLPLSLTLLGKTHQVEGVISNWKLKGDTATFDLDFDLSLKKCGISVPSVLLVVRVGDTIKLHAIVKLIRA